jgi:hypothetical protein
VLSPEYVCQSVVVMNETAVFQATSGATAGKCCELSESRCCRRKAAYMNAAPQKLTASTLKRYVVHAISLLRSTRQMR